MRFRIRSPLRDAMSDAGRLHSVESAILSAIANFFFIPYYPFWSIVVIALDIWVIWAVSRSWGMLGNRT